MLVTKILIVDDEPIMRESLAGWLERDGHYIDTSASGEDALKKLKDTRYDILLVDIKMEGISGLDVLKHVKESDPEIAVVMITAYGSIATAIEGPMIISLNRLIPMNWGLSLIKYLRIRLNFGKTYI